MSESHDNTNWPDGSAATTFAYLTTTGRISGSSHRIEIWFALADEKVYLLSGGRDRSDWVKNLASNPEVTVEIGTTSAVMHAEILADGTDADALTRRLLVAKYQKTNELEKWGRESLAIRLS